MTYDILFIDEEKSNHWLFNNFLNRNREVFTGTSVYPAATMDEMIAKIFEINPDAILTDYRLNDKKVDLPGDYTVEYSGGELVKEILLRKKDFPIFIATSFALSAAQDGQDVKRIYEKSDFKPAKEEDGGSQQHLTFRQRLELEITSYKNYLRKCSDSFDILLDKQNSEELTLKEEEELIQLDKILEASLDQRSRLPDELRDTSNTKRLVDLLSIARELLEKVK